MFYLRKITRGKWPGEKQIVQATLKDIQADTVLAEFKTDQNKLSVWEIETEADLEDAFIALGSNCSNIGRICVAKLSADDLSKLEMDNDEGDTPTIGINQKHRNICNLNYVSLGDVISSVLICFQDPDNRIITRSRPEMIRLLANAYKQNKLDIDKVNPSIVEDILKEIAKHNH